MSRFAPRTAYVLFCLSFLLESTEPATAALAAPGKREFEGWVVRREGGHLDVWNGFFCAGFPAEKTAALHQSLGKFVNVAFNMVKSEMSLSGVTFDRIESVTVIEENPEAFPISVSIEPAKKEFVSSEPIVAKVVLENRTRQPQSPGLVSSHAVLSKDYTKVIWLEPDKHDHPDRFYRFEQVRDMGWLNPCERMVFVIESHRMAEPGEYDLSYTLNMGAGRRYCVSPMAQIKVVPPADGNRAAVLRSWLKRAAFGQRIEIVRQLAAMGDEASVKEFVAQLEAGEDRKDGFFYHEAYRFAFSRGGEAGEQVMLDRIKHGKFQESITDYLRYAFGSTNRLKIFRDVLSCQHEVEMNVGGWVKHPRVCDITADLLMQRTSDKKPFPRQGDVTARDEAVGHVQELLKADPKTFRLVESDPSQ